MVLKIFINQIINISLQLILLLTVDMDDTACAYIPQSHCPVTTSRIQYRLVFTDPDRFNHARMTARFKEVLNVWRSDIDHVERVIRVGGEAELARDATGQGSWTRVLSSQVHRVRHLRLVIWLLPVVFPTRRPINIASLVKVLILLHELLRVEIPQAHFAVI